MNKKNNISLFTVSFKQGFIPPRIPIATFYQDGKKLNFLLDSGSDKNVLDNRILKEVKYEDVEGESVNLTGVGGVTQVNTCRIAFTCDNKEYVEDFLVTDLSEAFGLIEQDHCITLHGIIGSTFMRKNNIVMDFQNLVAYTKE